MLKETIQCEDFNGRAYEEEAYFNLTQAEITERELENTNLKEGKMGYAAMLETVRESGDGQRIKDVFVELLEWSYGRKSEDGRRFVKDPEFFKEFRQTNAYDKLFSELVTNPEKAAEFFNGILPDKLHDGTPRVAPTVDPLVARENSLSRMQGHQAPQTRAEARLLGAETVTYEK